MIVDVTNEIITKLISSITTCEILSAYPNGDTSFPVIVVEELSNNTDVETISSGGDQINTISLEVNIFSNLEAPLTQIRTLRKSVDDVLSGFYRMTREFSSSVPNYLNENIHRYTMRYSFKIDKNKKIYRG